VAPLLVSESLEAAAATFAACGAAFELARTDVLLGDPDAKARLDRFLRPAG